LWSDQHLHATPAGTGLEGHNTAASLATNEQHKKKSSKHAKGNPTNRRQHRIVHTLLHSMAYRYYMTNEQHEKKPSENAENNPTNRLHC